jgi:hypothetical protein
MNEEETPKKKRVRRSDTEDYVNNKEFSLSLAAYLNLLNEDKGKDLEPRPIPDDIAIGILKIANGLSRSPNFMNYSYREDMVMDAVENCITVLKNYDITKPTRTGTPNAFAYFTQISYYAFLRRIAKEKKQADIKQRLIDTSSSDVFADFEDDTAQIGDSIIERMRQNSSWYDDRLSTGEVDESFPKKKRGRPSRKAGSSEINLLQFAD